MLRKAFLALFGIGLAAGCGSRALRLVDDLGGRGDDRSRLDARAEGDGASPCAGLEALVGGKTVTTRHALDALFLPDRRGLILASVGLESEEAQLSLERFAGGRQILATVPSLRSIEWLVPGSQLLIVEPLSKMQPYSLSLLSLEPSASSLVAQGVCSHRVGAVGSLAFIEGCDQNWDGTLRVNLGGSSGVTIAKGVEGSSFVISPDGKRVAFISDVKHGSGGECGVGVGVLREWSAAAGDRVVAKDAVARTLQYLADSSLLWQSRPGCGSPAGDALVLGRPGEEPKTVASGLEFGYAFEGDLYQVSPNGRVVGAKPNTPDGPLTLWAAALDGSPAESVAVDVFSFYMTAMAFQPWRLTPGGKHLVYTTVAGYPQMGLASLDTGTWHRRPITTQLSGAIWASSPEGDAVAFVQGTLDSTSRSLRLSPLGGVAATLLAPYSGDSVARPTFLPDRRGLLYQERKTASVVELRRVSRAGGDESLLGSWSKSRLRTLPFEGAYRVDAAGCVVVFDADLGPEPGTRLRSLWP